MNVKETLSDMAPAARALSLFEEFKRFAFKGNLVDLAVAVIIGTAFGKVVDALVQKVIMPTIGLLTPAQQGYVDWKIVVGQKEIPYGLFLGEVVNFLIVSLVVFFVIVKFLGWMVRSKEREASAPPPATRDQQLLMEIRDLLKART